MLTDYASTGGQELWNTARLQAYLLNVGSPFDTGPVICACATLSPAMLGDESVIAYDTPATDPAPWYDADLPVSGEFLGFMPLSIDGLNNNPRGRTVTNAVGGGGVFGPSRATPRTLTVRGVLIGTSCCGVDYGMHYMSEALAGCSGDACDGDCFEMYACCPEEGTTPAQFQADSKRTFRRAALVSGPEVIRRSATGSCAQGNCSGADLVEIEFVIVAANPWAWTDPTPRLDVPLPIGDPEECIDWCVECSEGCLFAECGPASDACVDPRHRIPTPPQPSIPATAFCVPLGPERACYTIDLSDRPQWSNDVPIITVTAGSQEVRNIRITMYERQNETTLTCDQIADADRCAPVNDFVITYIPAGGSVTIDGQIGRATTECGGQCQTASTVYGDQDGGPVRINELTCASYCVCIETDGMFPPSPDAELSLSTSGRGL